MNRNTEHSFSENPVNLDIQRSKFDRTSEVSFTGNNGDLIPFFVDEVLPGDTFQIDTSFVHRMTTPIFPTMDNMVMDYYYFFVPNRLVWDHWKEFMGENTRTAWESEIEYQVPRIKAPEGGWRKGTIADYMGIPTNVENIEVNALPFRRYRLLWSEWFRDQNLKDPPMINKDETTLTGSNEGDYVQNAQLGAKPLKVAKNHDYFTSALPEPQKGPDVLLPIGGATGMLPIVTTTDLIDRNGIPLKLRKTDGQNLPGVYNKLLGVEITDQKPTTTGDLYAFSSSGIGTKEYDLQPANLWADARNATTNQSTINNLRQRFAIQRMLERDARGGTRYTEILKSHFGVTSPDSRQQRPEYLGGGVRIPININQVLQTSATNDVSPQGNTGAYSLTSDVSSNFTHSFTEHGFIIGVMCTRILKHTYQYGLEKFWSRKSRYDYYFPALANLGEMPIYNKEIYAQGTAEDDEVFGYQEAWADYRYKPNRVAGAFRSNYQTTLDSWHYADKYTQLPRLSSEWIDEGVAEVDRTLTVQSSVEDQFIMNIRIQNIVTRPMPLYSIPGLLDHN